MITQLPALPNLKAVDVQLVTLPPSLPRPVFESKKKFKEWCLSDRTEHAFLSIASGLNPHLRVSNTNQATKIFGYCADFDHRNCDIHAALKDAEELKKNRRPSYLQETFSGGLRAYWIFEQEVPVASNAHAKELLVLVEKEVQANWLARGLDQNSTRADITFEAGGRWIATGYTVPKELVQGWALSIIQKRSFAAEGDGVEVPIESVRDALAEKYPDAWSGGWPSFDVDARGTRFWEGGDSMSVIVRPEGLTCFTGDRAFIPWSFLLGTDWVRDTARAQLTSKIEGCYFDGTNGRYMRRYENGAWYPNNKDDLLLHLASRGLNRTRTQEDMLSPAEQAMVLVNNSKIIDGCVEMFFCRDEVVYMHGRRLLNTGKLQSPLFPVDQMDAGSELEWGAKFPWIAGYFDRLFLGDEHDQKGMLLKWLRHFYQSALEGDVRYGLGLILIGASNTGKTFFANTFLRKVFGAAASCDKYMLGQDQFTSDLVRCPVWHMSDPILETSKEVARMGDFLKQVVANHEVKCRAMRAVGFDQPWNGRVVISINNDPESLQAMPSLSNSAEDKVLGLMILAGSGDWVPVTDEVLDVELPWFLRWLLDQGDLRWASGERFGLPGWVHPEMRQIALENSRSSEVLDQINKWVVEYFEHSHVEGSDFYYNEDTVRISPGVLWNLMANHPVLGLLFTKTVANSKVLGLHLTKISAKFPEFLEKGQRTKTSVTWLIKKGLLD